MIMNYEQEEIGKRINKLHNANKTHCIRGHLLPKRTKYRKVRACKICNLTRAREKDYNKTAREKAKKMWWEH